MNMLNMDFISSNKFVEFLKKFTTIDSNALVELRKDNKIMIKSYTASRTAVKYASVPLVDIFDVDDDYITEDIKIGVYNLEKLIKLFSYIGENDKCSFIVNYSKDGQDNYAKNFIIKTDIFEKTYKCANKKLFKYMDDSLLEGIFGISDDINFSFKLETSMLNRIQNLSALETSSELSFVTDGNSVKFKGSSYVIDYFGESDINNGNEKAIISKDYLKYTDSENYTVYVNDASCLFISNDSDTKIALGRVPDENEPTTSPKQDDETSTADEDILDGI